MQMTNEEIVRLAAYEDFMERWKLTRIEDADRIFQRVNALGGTDLMKQYRGFGPIDHLRELVQAEKDGRLVVLPCKEGDPIWWIDVAWLPQKGSMYFKISSGTFRYAMLDWQNPIYTSQADAEAALKKREGGSI